MVLSYTVTDSELFFRKMHFFEIFFGKESGIFVDKVINLVIYLERLSLAEPAEITEGYDAISQYGTWEKADCLSLNWELGGAQDG
jgi:hypothetical protein